MNNLLLRIFFVLFVSFMLIGFNPYDVFADKNKITSQSFSLENTSIIAFTNNSNEKIKTIKIWLTNSSFISFKLENNWTSPIASQNTIIFTTLEPIKTNETVKLGMKTEKSNPLIHWEVFDEEDNQIEVGKTQSETMQSFVSEPEVIKEPVGIFPESTFKVVPKNPHPGSTIRVTGDNFAPTSSLELFLSDTKIKSFETNENGYFMLTLKIPKKIMAEQVNFVLKDKQKNEKIISVYLTEVEQQITENIPLTVSNAQNNFLRTDKFEFSGTANPNTTIIIKIKNPQGNLFSTMIKNTDSKGFWSASINLPLHAPLGEYSTEITDGKNTINDSWDVVMSKKVHVLPTKLIFKSEELIKFNVTANPGERIKIKFVDPQENEVLSRNFIVNPSGFFEIEYPTLSSSSKGTYVLYAFQGHDTEIVFIGLDKYPQKTLSAKLNDVNYHSEDVAIIGMTGKDSQNIKLLIIDQNGNEKFNDNIQLSSDGKGTYHLSLTKFPPGIYTLLVSMGNLQASEVFTVGFQLSSMTIDLYTNTKTYNPGQSIHVLGKSEPNTTVDLFLIDPNGSIISENESFTNKNGELLISNFVIPYDVTFGKWIVRAEGISKSVNFEFQVNPLEKELQSVRVTDVFSLSIGTFVTIEGFVPEEQTVEIIIVDRLGNTVFQTNVMTTESGEFDLLWRAPPESLSGTYSVIVTDSFEKTITTTFDL